MTMMLWAAALAWLTAKPDLPLPSPVRPPQVTMQVRPCAPAIDPKAWVVLACELSVPEGWHIYWRNPGSSGAPTSVVVDTPDGFEVKPVVFPRPEIFSDPGGATYGYTGQVTLLIPIYPPDRPEDRPLVEFRIQADWLVCREACFAGSAEATVRLPWGDPAVGRVELDPWATALLAEARWPRPLSVRPATTARYEDGMLVVTGPTTRAGEIGFLPDPTPGVTLGRPTITTNQSRFTLSVPVELEMNNTLGESPLARGLLTFGDRATMPSFEVSVSLPENASSTDRQLAPPPDHAKE